MTSMKTAQKQQDGILSSILLLTGFFFLLEVSFFIQCNRAYLSDFTFVSNHIQIPAAVLPGMFYFLFAQVVVHGLFALMIWLIATALIKQWQIRRENQLTSVIAVWLLGCVTVMVANQYFYPNSKFAELTHLFLVNPPLTQYVFFALLFLCVPLIVLTMVAWVKRFILPACLIMLVMGSLYGYIHRDVKITSAATAAQPNVIIVGVDSLRPDFLGYFGRDIKTPFFDSFLNNAATFSDAVTPLARTFPSWTSVLTGQYPRQTGVRFNLAIPQHVNFNNTIPTILRQHGYATLFATDESRFSNIDTNFGFDQVVTPSMGLNDFLIGTFNDFPISNLVTNLGIGKWLFPHSYANRPVFVAYNPNSFLSELHDLIYQQRQQPIFLAVHFCLPHYPYLWAQLDGTQYSILERYQMSVQRADVQVNDFFNMLQQTHMLDHAIVIMMSDHGEALELHGDRITERNMFIHTAKESVPNFYPASLDDEEIDQSAGHGTDVLGLPQYHSLLAFRVYGGKAVDARSIAGIVSLLDIKPTILQLLNLPSAQNSGISLVDAIHGVPNLPMHDHIFLESDYSPQAIRTVYPETRKVMLEGIELFQIDKHSTRLTVKDTMAHMIINSKQYADIYGEWMLAMYPQSNILDMPILINLNTGEWTNNLDSPLALHSPAHEMLQRMQAFFGSDLRESSLKLNIAAASHSPAKLHKV